MRFEDVAFEDVLFEVDELLKEVGGASEKDTAEEASAFTSRSSAASGAMRSPRRLLSAFITSFEVPAMRRERLV
jgi:hypothetical protein